MRLVRLMLPLLLLLPLTVAAETVEEAGVLLKAKDPRAAAAIKALVKSRPRDAEAHILHARLLLQAGKADDAIDAAEEAVDLAPGSAQAHYWLGNAYGSRIGEVGTLTQAMMAPKLRVAFERAIELDPGLNEARGHLVEFYLQAPAIVGGGIDKARLQAAELSRRDPPLGDLAKGKIAMKEGDMPAAARSLEAAYLARPANADIRNLAGLAFQESKQWEKAFALYEAWTRAEPKASAAWYQIGRASALSGQRTAQGIEALRKYLAMPRHRHDPEAKHAWYRLGQVQAHAGDKAAARASFGQALKEDAKFADAKSALAML